MDNACVELKFAGGRTIAVENEIADNMHQRPELDDRLCKPDIER